MNAWHVRECLACRWVRLRYPENLTVPNMLYFLAVPTLTYQVRPWLWVEGLGTRD